MPWGSWGRLWRKDDVEKRQTAPGLWLPKGRLSVETCSEARRDGVGRFHPSALCLTSHSLNPFTSYKLRVKATNDIGDSDFSAETEAVTTLQDGKREAARQGHRRQWALPGAPGFAGAAAGCSPLGPWCENSTASAVLFVGDWYR